MAIPDEDIAAVRSSTDFPGLVGEYTQLKRQGRRLVGLCPFHSEKSPSFSVNPEEGLYYCFGCMARGDAITFLRTIEGCSFVEAVERLAARAGVRIRNETSEADRDRRRRETALYEAIAKSVEYYHDRLLSHDEAAKARQYLRSRGIEGGVVRTFKLGFAPEGAKALSSVLKIPPAVLIGAGLVAEGSYGPRDVFRGRIIFPIAQPDGRPVAIGGRLLPGVGDGRGPKYRNSAESPIYKKGSTLYALDLSRQSIVKTSEVIVCEGYTDVIGLFQVGLPRAVATCGTALTEDHFKLLSRFGRRIVLAFDADRAGQEAAARFYEWERRHDVEVAVADLPEGRDPGDLALSDPDELRRAISGAVSYLQFRLDRVLESQDLGRPEGRAKAAEAAMAVIAEHPHELVRDQYLVHLADMTRVPVDQLRPRLKAVVNGPKHRAPPARSRPAVDAASRLRPGYDALALAIHEPAAMASRLDECLFTDPLQLETFRALIGATSLHEAISTADEEVAQFLLELANSDPDSSPDQAVVALVRARVSETVFELGAAAKQAQAAGDEEALLRTAPVVAWLKSELELFTDVGAGEHPPKSVTDAADRLIAWLATRRGEDS